MTDPLRLANDDRARPDFGHPSREASVHPSSEPGASVTVLLVDDEEISISLVLPGAPDEEDDYMQVTMRRDELLQFALGAMRVLSV